MVNHPTRNCNFAGMLPPFSDTRNRVSRHFLGDPPFSNALKWGQFFLDRKLTQQCKNGYSSGACRIIWPSCGFRSWVHQPIGYDCLTFKLSCFDFQDITNPFFWVLLRPNQNPNFGAFRPCRFSFRQGIWHPNRWSSCTWSRNLWRWSLPMSLGASPAGGPQPRGKTCGLY